MGRASGAKETVKLALYDAFVVGRHQTFGTAMMSDSRLVTFFTATRKKTPLETNLQTPAILPRGSRFEAQALRVVCSPLAEGREQVTTAQFLTALLFQSVVTLRVGEQAMIEVPTCYLPAGVRDRLPAATPGADAVGGAPDPMAPFRFADPVMIEAHQRFRVELLFPGHRPANVEKAHGEFRLWVVLDGCLTRDVPVTGPRPGARRRSALTGTGQEPAGTIGPGVPTAGDCRPWPGSWRR